MITGETIVDCGNVGSPHQDHNAHIVKFVAELRDCLAVVTQEVESRLLSARQYLGLL